MSSSRGIKLTSDLLSTFEVGKVFSETSSDYSIDFDHSGSLCLTSSADETLRLYDARAGRQVI